MTLSAEVSPSRALPPVIIAHHLADRGRTSRSHGSRSESRALLSTGKQRERERENHPEFSRRCPLFERRICRRICRCLRCTLGVYPLEFDAHSTASARLSLPRNTSLFPEEEGKLPKRPQRETERSATTRVSSCRGCGARTTTSTSLPDRWIKLGGAVPVGVRTPHSLSFSLSRALLPLPCTHTHTHTTDVPPPRPLVSRSSALSSSFLSLSFHQPPPTCALPPCRLDAANIGSRRRHPSTLQGAPAHHHHHHHHHHPCRVVSCRVSTRLWPTIRSRRDQGWRLSDAAASPWTVFEEGSVLAWPWPVLVSIGKPSPSSHESRKRTRACTSRSSSSLRLLSMICSIGPEVFTLVTREILARRDKVVEGMEIDDGAPPSSPRPPPIYGPCSLFDEFVFQFTRGISSLRAPQDAGRDPAPKIYYLSFRFFSISREVLELPSSREFFRLPLQLLEFLVIFLRR